MWERKVGSDPKSDGLEGFMGRSVECCFWACLDGNKAVLRGTQMGNAIEKQKPLKRSHLCPWKPGKKTLHFVPRKKGFGRCLLGRYGVRPDLSLRARPCFQFSMV
ncbi:hypothetical protein MG293_004082 [Ovis ammon polii]|uniref:Uncharacterized protein n=1 Tax=Ovis ammon polii TaxID=230172 RepID=A0AAD4YHJ7_OVIAM|nr:hypothetical protein MG293_004082 [Ovis ammon polii]